MTLGLFLLDNAFDAQVLTLGLERNRHVTVATVSPEPAVGAVENRRLPRLQ